MKLSRRPHRNMVAMNMTPMIDVVFQLLIFFMLSNQASEVNKKVLELPKLKGSEDQIKSNLIVNVDEFGGLEVGGKPRTLPEVESLVGDELVKVGGDPRRVTIVVRSDRRGNSRGVNEVVKRLVALGLTQIQVSVESDN